MRISDYTLIEKYMLETMEDSAHDKDHVYRVLYTALEIAQSEADVDYDVLITACLLHDIGRKEQYDNPALCHAAVGAEKAGRFLQNAGFDKEFAERVGSCIAAHRFRSDHPPVTTEEKILFDADKIDATGTLGIARTICYQGYVREPLYTLDPDGEVSDGSGDSEASFFHEYRHKLEGLYSRFFTRCGREIAQERQHSAVYFYRSMLEEVASSHQKGKTLLRDKIADEYRLGSNDKV